MRRKLALILCGLAAMSMTFGSTAVTFASETESEIESSATETETEDESEAEVETEKAADVEVIFEEDVLLFTLDNQTGTEFTASELSENTLTLTDADGKDHVFSDFDYEKIVEPSLVWYGSFMAVEYTPDGSDEVTRFVEEGEEIAYDETETLYATADVNVREDADRKSKSLKVISVGDEISAIAEQPEWVKISLDEDTEGYVFKAYVTRDEEKAKEAKEAAEKAAAEKAAAKREAAEKAAAQQAAAAAAAAANAAQTEAPAETQAPQTEAPVETQAPQTEAPQTEAPAQTERYEVSRQAYDDCDGSGHGYYEITYSDGTVETEEY